MNTLSNIEFINFDYFGDQNEEEYLYNLSTERDCELNFLKMLHVEKFDCEILDKEDSFSDNKSLSLYSDNGKCHSCNTSLLGDPTYFTDNSKCINLNDSFSNSEKFHSNSFSHMPSDSRTKLNRRCSLYNESFEFDEEKEFNDDSFNLNKSKEIDLNKITKIIENNLNNEQKKFTCKIENCKKSYKSKENLILHYKNIHLKEKPYSCQYCPATFSHRNGNK